MREALENAREADRYAEKCAREIPRKAVSVSGSVVLELAVVETNASYGDFAAPPSGWTIYVWVDGKIQSSRYYGFERYEEAVAEYQRLRDTYKFKEANE